MPNQNIIKATNDAEVWKIIADQLSNKKDSLDYTAQWETSGRVVTLDIDLDAAAGDDNEKPLTSFSAKLPEETSFSFSIVKQGIRHSIGKLFGMQDVVIGHDEFDRNFLVQSNDEARVKQIFSNEQVNAELISQPVVVFEIREDKIGAFRQKMLGLDVDGGITDAAILERLYRIFRNVLDGL